MVEFTLLALAGVLAIETAIVFVWAGSAGPSGAAMGSCVAAALGCVAPPSPLLPPRLRR